MYPGQAESPGSPIGEPMNLGSPVSSPNNPVNYQGQQYLPSFLIGDPVGSPLNNSRLWNSPGPSQISPQRNRNSFNPTLSASPSRVLFSPTNPNNSISRTYIRPNPTDKHGGPPTQGLFDHPPTPARSTLVGGSVSPTALRNTSLYASTTNTPVKMENLMGHENSGKNFNFIQSPAQIDPFYTQGHSLSSNDTLDETWITIFGFPPAAATYILQQFYHYGTIIEHRLPPSGNWMHIKYQTKLQSKIALSKNGKVFGNYMVGVTPCIDKSVLVQTPHKTMTRSIESPNMTMVLENGNQSPFASAEYSVINPGHIPQKRTGFFSKAKELLFNW